VRPDLAIAARFETEERVSRYPSLIRQGKIDGEAAQIDTECWDAIAVGFEQDRPFGAMLAGRALIGWPMVLASLDRALATRLRATRAAPDDVALATRNANVVEIARIVRRQALFFIEITAELHRRARPDQVLA
jgi:hypothetical protein